MDENGWTEYNRGEVINGIHEMGVHYTARFLWDIAVGQGLDMSGWFYPRLVSAVRAVAADEGIYPED